MSEKSALFSKLIRQFLAPTGYEDKSSFVCDVLKLTESCSDTTELRAKAGTFIGEPLPAYNFPGQGYSSPKDVICNYMQERKDCCSVASDLITWFTMNVLQKENASILTDPSLSQYLLQLRIHLENAFLISVMMGMKKNINVLTPSVISFIKKTRITTRIDFNFCFQYFKHPVVLKFHK